MNEGEQPDQLGLLIGLLCGRGCGRKTERDYSGGYHDTYYELDDLAELEESLAPMEGDENESDDEDVGVFTSGLPAGARGGGAPAGLRSGGTARPPAGLLSGPAGDEQGF